MTLTYDFEKKRFVSLGTGEKMHYFKLGNEEHCIPAVKLSFVREDGKEKAIPLGMGEKISYANSSSHAEVVFDRDLYRKQLKAFLEER